MPVRAHALGKAWSPPWPTHVLAWGRHTASEHMHSQWCESAVKSHQLLACLHRTTTVTGPVGQCGLDTGRDMHTGVPEPVVVSVVRHMRVRNWCCSYTEHVKERGSYVKLKVLVVALVPRSGWWTLASTCTPPRWSFAALACGCVMHAHACRCASATVQPHSIAVPCGHACLKEAWIGWRTCRW